MERELSVAPSAESGKTIVPAGFGVDVGEREFLVTIGAGAALLCAFVFLGSMTYTLVHYRSWYELAAFLVSLIFAIISLLSVVPLLMARHGLCHVLVGRLSVWGTCLALASLQLTASVLGDATFSMSAIIGITTVIAVAAFGELAGHGAVDD
ncbi:hypothetical protein V1J52_25465 [Streptomyces sp. TRM 70351]|uniref:hypothetical protein n=1 Tax=Streptomyces sp. TRM 70351 TaxID=3116552 RepID=UPI002E7B6766|nr:hypothetical protein [Streptomyces sp. TRM 70351]MEE1931471.1 hypothetical protein [Streptomyces sp. TRM 70351]